MELERGRWEAAQFEELRDTLSRAASEWLALSHKDPEHEPHLGRFQDESARLLVTLDDKSDLRIFQVDALLRVKRTKLDLVSGITATKPWSGALNHCKRLIPSLNCKTMGAIRWQDRDGDVDGQA